MSQVTQTVDAIGRGGEHASEQLLPVIYQELRRLAANMLAQEPPGQTLQATALVHEAYVRVVGSEEEQKWKHRGHFFTAAAEAMRRILGEKARRKQRVKHGGEQHRVENGEKSGRPRHRAVHSRLRWPLLVGDAALLMRIGVLAALEASDGGHGVRADRSRRMKPARKNRIHEALIIDVEELPFCPQRPSVPVLPE